VNLAFLIFDNDSRVVHTQETLLLYTFQGLTNFASLLLIVEDNYG